MNKGRYIFGIIKTNDKISFGLCGINTDEEVYTINYDGIACVVSNSPITYYKHMLKEELGRFLVKHQKIIEKIMETHNVIPVKFGTYFSDDEEVMEILRRGSSKFKDTLSIMNSKIELDVVATWNDLNSIIKEMGENDKKIQEFKDDIANKDPEKTFQDRIKIGMMIKDALNKMRNIETTHTIDYLKAITTDVKKHQMKDEKMIFNLAFLLESSNESDFDSKLKELDNEYKQKVNFRCVGPLPPYSFATCELKKIEYKKLDEARQLLCLKDKIILEDIKCAYKEFVQKNHPDKHPDDLQIQKKFENVTKAYKLLTSCCQDGAISFDDNKRKDFISIEIIQP